MSAQDNKFERATLAGGCFWCTEAIFKRLMGVVSVVPGYSGGSKPNPTYEEVCTGNTGHAEAIQIKFDPKVISFEQLLEVFLKLHDPTTLNRQGNDMGSQYRSAIFFHNAGQKEIAQKMIKRLEKSGAFNSQIVTQIEPFRSFFEAENYHRNYYDKNRMAGYCQVVIDPKIHKLYKDFKDTIKEEYLG